MTEYILTEEAAREAFWELSRLDLHRSFPGYLGLKWASSKSGTTDDFKFNYNDFFDTFFKVREKEIGKPYVIPFNTDRDPDGDSSSMWLQHNAAGSYGPSHPSDRTFGQMVEEVTGSGTSADWELVDDYWTIARDEMLDGNKVPVELVAAFVLRDFVIKMDEPGPEGLIEAFCDEFGYNKKASDFIALYLENSGHINSEDFKEYDSSSGRGARTDATTSSKLLGKARDLTPADLGLQNVTGPSLDLDEIHIDEFSEDARNAWQVQPGTNKHSYPEVLWPIWVERNVISVGWDIGPLSQLSIDELNPQSKALVSRMSPGDIVVAKGGHYDLLGLGVVTPDGYEYVGGTDCEITFSNGGESDTHPCIRHVEWFFTRSASDAIDIEDWGVSKQFDNRTVVAYDCFEELRDLLVEKIPSETMSPLQKLERASVDYATNSYFILQTGSDKWEDKPAEQYHFKMGIPGSRKLGDAETARVLYLEDGEIYARARIVEIHKEERGDETHCFADVEEYEELDPVEVNSVRGEFESSISLQHPIIEITGRDYRIVVDSGTSTRYFWVNAEATNWQQDGGDAFYQVTGSSGKKRRNQEAYQKAQPGDEVLVYQISPEKRVVGRAHVARGLHEESVEKSENPVEGITLRWEESVDGVSWAKIESDSELENSRLVESDNNFVITELSEQEYDRILELTQKTTFGDFVDDLEVPVAEITVDRKNLYFPDGTDDEQGEWGRIQSRIEQALANGNHVLLFGPPGTGKTKLARQVCEDTVGDDYELVTASADWSTFDTVGGYQTTSQNTLEFEPGIVLDRFQDDTNGSPTNEWLIIDELNRADIDKAFGSLFSALTGESVTLPFDGPNEKPIQILDASQTDAEVDTNKFYIPEDWRMIATINTLDKTSLYEMSYAFMRRWAFIPVGIPELPERTDEDDSELEELVEEYVKVWAADGSVPEAKQHYEPVGRIWRAVNDERSIGPAIVEDIYEYVAAAPNQEDADYVSPLIMYVFPQLEGLRRTELEGLIEQLDSIVDDEHGELWTVARDFFQIDLQPSDEE